jgi:hypothetical protein
MGSRGTGIITATIIPWRDGWYRCAYIVSSATMDYMSLFLVTSTISPREESNTHNTSICVAGAHIEACTFATSYIPTTIASAVIRGGNYASITGPNFISWYNTLEGTIGVEFETL